MVQKSVDSFLSSPSALKQLQDQPQVQQLLGHALRENRIGHAYLFVGAPGSGKGAAAKALAQCVLCEHGGDASCEECIRISRGTHPDFHILSPQSATGYLIEQIRQLISDVNLAPMRGTYKIYLIDRADMLRENSANALLKTLEEPPSDTIFILSARSTSTVLSTIVSRCQVVTFKTLTDAAAQAAIMREISATKQEACIALSITKTPSRAVEFLQSPTRRNIRKQLIDIFNDLQRNDSWDVLTVAKELVDVAKIPLGDIRRAQEEALEQSEDFLTASALKQVEAANKRELTARERSGIIEMLAILESLLRDVLLRVEAINKDIVNTDAAGIIDRVASQTYTQGVLEALAAIQEAQNNLDCSVSVQLTLEVMLLHIKEALACPPLSR